jgi:hypothetical protein
MNNNTNPIVPPAIAAQYAAAVQTLLDETVPNTMVPHLANMFQAAADKNGSVNDTVAGTFCAFIRFADKIGHIEQQ